MIVIGRQRESKSTVVNIGKTVCARLMGVCVCLCVCVCTSVCMWGRDREKKGGREVEKDRERERFWTSSPKAKGQIVIRFCSPLFHILKTVTLHLCEQARASSDAGSEPASQWVWLYREGYSFAFTKLGDVNAPTLPPLILWSGVTVVVCK